MNPDKTNRKAIVTLNTRERPASFKKCFSNSCSKMDKEFEFKNKCSTFGCSLNVCPFLLFKANINVTFIKKNLYNYTVLP